MENILQTGFSAVVAAFLLMRMERELRALREAIVTLRHCPQCRLSPFALMDEAEVSDGQGS